MYLHLVTNLTHGEEFEIQLGISWLRLKVQIEIKLNSFWFWLEFH
jgi:hypothetical protein